MRGFHLRVRWPKWTPVSSRAFLLMTDMRATSVALGLRPRPPRPEPRFRGTPDPVGRRVGYPLAGARPVRGRMAPAKRRTLAGAELKSTTWKDTAPRDRGTWPPRPLSTVATRNPDL